MLSLDQRLARQNTQSSWRPCEYTPRRRHVLEAPERLPSGSVVRRCRRCPVVLYFRDGPRAIADYVLEDRNHREYLELKADAERDPGAWGGGS